MPDRVHLEPDGCSAVSLHPEDVRGASDGRLDERRHRQQLPARLRPRKTRPLVVFRRGELHEPPERRPSDREHRNGPARSSASVPGEAQKLPLQKPRAGAHLIDLGRTVLHGVVRPRRTALDRIADEDVSGIDRTGLERGSQNLAASPDERAAARVLVLSRSLADENELRREAPLPRNRERPRLRKRARGAARDGFAYPVHLFMTACHSENLRKTSEYGAHTRKLWRTQGLRIKRRLRSA